MNRREIIALVGSTAAFGSVAPLIERAAASEAVRRIGVLTDATPENANAKSRLSMFLRGLHDAGWVVGRNLEIEYRWGADDAERTLINARELVALKPDVILTSGSPGVAA